VNTQNREYESEFDRSVRTIAGREIVFDKDGFLMDFEDWSEEVFEWLAKESGLSRIDDQHWRVIWFLRSFYAYNRRAPLHRQLKEGTGMSLLEIDALFPNGIKTGARRMAGLPNPKSC
jgi:dissimilatory sulfite reductase related protein